MGGLREFIRTHTGVSCLSGAATHLTNEGRNTVKVEQLLNRGLPNLLMFVTFRCITVCSVLQTSRASGLLRVNLPSPSSVIQPVEPVEPL